ncbi:site-2 protease family protein [Olsenella sp. oral taxon 809]|uniref:site-2 protease family protein n=1 Tax=Olsenella sp. oral taxon 809 TaxID=661086 RepID=UPI0002D65516|nr:site-2 protease family protein [Olsenella sp. oral taxon 809]
MDLSLMSVVGTLVSVGVAVLSLVLHELAHAWAALMLGDPTAKEQGRLTLNPAAHLDPFGSVLLPVLMALAQGPVFGYARPVPFDPRRLRHPARDEALVALAGPACNLLQAVVAGLAFQALAGFWDGGYGLAYWLLRVTSSWCYVNCSLAFFNLIPLPPLDGSKLLSPFLRGEGCRIYQQVQAYSMPILLVVLYVLPGLLGFDPLSSYLRATAIRLAGHLLGA